jgi:hypothetical protein
MNKIFFLICPILLLSSCKKSNLDFTSGIEMADIKKMNITKDKNLRIGLSYFLNQDTIITEYNLKSYSLLVLKFDNINSINKIRRIIQEEENNNGTFTSINQISFNFMYNLDTNTKQKVFEIDLVTDKPLIVKNDSIASYGGDFNQFRILVNNIAIVNSEKRRTIDGIPSFLSANFLFYKLNNKIYLFVMSPQNPKKMIGNKILYNYLFKNVTSS